MKLRQFPGRERRHVAVDTASLAWQPGPVAGTAIKDLYRQAGFRDTMRLERWEAGTDRGTVAYPEGTELLVLDGEFSDEAGSYPRGCWLRQPASSTHHPRTANGCELYVKTGGFAYLQPGI